MKTTEAIREKIEVAAAASGRSLTQEVEHRLEQSFDREALLAQVREAILAAEAVRRYGSSVGTDRNTIFIYPSPEMDSLAS